MADFLYLDEEEAAAPEPKQELVQASPELAPHMRPLLPTVQMFNREISQEIAKLQAFDLMVRKFEVNTDHDHERIIDSGKQTKVLAKAIDQAYEKHYGTTEELLKEVKAAKKKVLDLAKAIEDLCKGKSSQYKTKLRILKEEQERKQREEIEALNAKMAEEAAGKDLAPPPEIPLPPKAKEAPVHTSGGSTSYTTKRWTWDQENVDLDKLIYSAGTYKEFRKYLMVKPAEVTSAVRAGVRDIPGIRIFQQESEAFR